MEESYRSEMKKLVFRKSQALKKCKSKAEKTAVELSFQKLEQDLLIQRSPQVVVLVEEETERNDTQLIKSRQRREDKLEKQKKREAEIRDLVGDGSAELALQAAEMQAIIARLADLGRTLEQVAPDGDCLFASLMLGDTRVLREKVAEYLVLNESEFAPFVDDSVSFPEYCESIRNNAWGSDIELQAISRIFNIGIRVVTVDGIVEFGDNSLDPVTITYHARQYTSPHYNATRLI